MKVWLVISEQRDKNGDVCNYCILGVYDTYIQAKEKQRNQIYYWQRADRKISYIGKDTAVSFSKYGISSVVYVEERAVK